MEYLGNPTNHWRLAIFNVVETIQHIIVKVSKSLNYDIIARENIIGVICIGKIMRRNFLSLLLLQLLDEAIMLLYYLIKVFL